MKRRKKKKMSIERNAVYEKLYMGALDDEDEMKKRRKVFEDDG